jgi:chromosome partitioning protein
MSKGKFCYGTHNRHFLQQRAGGKMETRVQSGLRTIALCANKGGVGKTRMTILTANYLGAIGKRVLVIDMDFNNSATFYYLDGEKMKEAVKKNAADAMAREDNNLADYSLETGHSGVHILASSRYLSDLRSVSEKRLSRMIPGIENAYDIVIIDCQPDYNNLTLNAINASDLIITPVLKDLDSYNAACFLGQKIALDTEKKEAWYITINGYNRQYETAKGGKQKEYLEIYKNEFALRTGSAAWFPWTADMNDIKDRKMPLSCEVIPGTVCNSSLYDAVIKLSEYFVNGELSERPVKF